MKIVKSKTFIKDLEKITSSSKGSTCNKILERIQEFSRCKANNLSLPSDFKDHALNDNKIYKNCRECHLRGDTLLVYRIENDEVELVLLRIGSHSQLFSSLEYSDYKSFSIKEALDMLKNEWD